MERTGTVHIKIWRARGIKIN